MTARHRASVALQPAVDASLRLVRRIGGVPVAAAVVIELTFLHGRNRLGDLPTHSLVKY